MSKLAVLCLSELFCRYCRHFEYFKPDNYTREVDNNTVIQLSRCVVLELSPKGVDMWMGAGTQSVQKISVVYRLSCQ